MRAGLNCTFASVHNPIIFNNIFLFAGFDFYTGNKGAAFEYWKDIIPIFAPRSRNEDFDAIGKAKYLFCARAIAQRWIKGAENA